MINSFYTIPRIGGLAYLNIGKAACTSILLALSRMRSEEDFEPPRDILPDGSEPIHGFVPPYSHMEHFFRRWPLSYPPLPSSFVRFTFVRNPYDRFYSFYKSKIIAGQTPVAFYEEIGIKRGCSFEECVHGITSIDPNRLEHHIAPQSMIVLREKDFLVDFVGKVESFDEEWPVIQKLTGYHVELEQANVTGKPDEPIYSADLKDRIYRYYRDDFELFGYEKDSVPISNNGKENTGNVHSSHCLHNSDITEFKNQILASNHRIRDLAEAFDEDPEKRHIYFKQQKELHHEMILKDVWLLEEKLNRSDSIQNKYSQIQSRLSSDLEALQDGLKRQEEISLRKDREFRDTIHDLSALEMIVTDKITGYEEAMNKAESRLDILQKRTESSRSNVDDLKAKSNQIEEGFLEDRKSINRIEQELGAFRKNAWKTIKRHTDSLKNKELRINQNKKKYEDLENQLIKVILAEYLRARRSIWKRLHRFIRLRAVSETKLLLRSGLVDPHYYFSSYPDTIETGMSAARHYVRRGAQEGKNPSENFNTMEYLANHPDVAHEGLNPLVHFILNI